MEIIILEVKAVDEAVAVVILEEGEEAAKIKDKEL